ncbi:GerMN domain-containing protein [Cohnella silvisoli]|uniref:GerMN domain-containing protein n=1 Tax=Cohnella silvisoli TaxID=2873699 RepID=A0ABV1KTS3_9BACL|nr:GerMN domain-containing protein [Cohnella silvisoli]MCD9022757.1 GerMN domain-containing protein [Cohnella silvisoli]
MMRKMSYRNKWLMRWGALLLLLPLLSACGRGPGTAKDETASIDPPPSSVEQTMLNDTVTAHDTKATDVVTVYLLDRNGYLAPISMRMDAEQSSPRSSAEEAITWMTANEQLADQLPPGFTAVLPAGTKVSSVTENKSEGSISIDFAAPFPSSIASQERKVLEALVWTLTEIPGIDKVKLSAAGKPLTSLTSSGLPIDQVLTRGVGINLETGQGVQVNRSMAVTLYFSAQSAEGEGYFVPVTRLINRQANPAKAALEQLILGPQKSKALKPVLTSDMTIEKLTQMADTVSVSLQDAGWMPQSPVPSEMMEALVLTLSEATGMPQVRVVMNGDDSLVDSDNRSYDHPVIRPTSINALVR